MELLRKVFFFTALMAFGLFATWSITQSSAQNGSSAYCGPVDVAFVTDTTGSMAASINGLRNGLPELLRRLDSVSRGDYRVGMIEVNSSLFGGDGIIINTSFTTNTAKLHSIIDAYYAHGGGGTPEIWDEATLTAITNRNALDVPANHQQGDFSVPWRSNVDVLRMVVVITDAPPSGLDSTFDPLVDVPHMHDIALQAASAGIKLVMVQIGEEAYYPTKAIMEDAAATTGGAYYLAENDATDLASALDQVFAGCGELPSTPIPTLPPSTATSTPTGTLAPTSTPMPTSTPTATPTSPPTAIDLISFEADSTSGMITWQTAMEFRTDAMFIHVLRGGILVWTSELILPKGSMVSGASYSIVFDNLMPGDRVGLFELESGSQKEIQRGDWITAQPSGSDRQYLPLVTR